jgi:hypothetical protein
MPIFHYRAQDLGDESNETAGKGRGDAIDKEEIPSADKCEPPSTESVGVILKMNDGRPISRDELIEKLKREHSPTWKFRHGVSEYFPIPSFFKFTLTIWGHVCFTAFKRRPLCIARL